uniref:LacI family DNA-binding transcriptional regulator n=1 Tax=Streptomyces albiflavescens TaxID=1623582 RepID=UPI001E45910C|nr:LacI family DNA-binding transcriptional regulator [Streptomyces albiflavescens]
MAEQLIGQRPTLEDVARRAGVSKSTVSRVVNGEPKVRAAVAERIRKAVAELGYVHRGGLDRLDGYRDVLLDAPPPLIAEGDYTLQGGADAMALLLDQMPDLDAVFVASDLMAFGALRTLRERGRTVPGDVAVVGFGNLTPLAETTEPPLTTVHQDIEERGRLMARLLCSRSAHQPLRGVGPRCLPSVVTPTRLVLRNSA